MGITAADLLKIWLVLGEPPEHLRELKCNPDDYEKIRKEFASRIETRIDGYTFATLLSGVNLSISQAAPKGKMIGLGDKGTIYTIDLPKQEQ